MMLKILRYCILFILLLGSSKVFSGLPNTVDGEPLPSLAPMRFFDGFLMYRNNNVSDVPQD